MKKSVKHWSTRWLLGIVIALTVLPLAIVKESDFGGADGKAEEAITELHPQYEPWFEPVLQPPGGETEGLLFALQAALGAGMMGYAIGWYRGRDCSSSPQDNDGMD